MRKFLFAHFLVLSWFVVPAVCAASAPSCGAIGTRSEGWYSPSPPGEGAALIKFANCASCIAECRAAGTRSEGWYDSCDGTLIAWSDCEEESFPVRDFTDVPQSSPFAKAIAYVRDEGIVDGYPDGTFRPDAPINRAEFTKIITVYDFGYKTVSQCETHYFSDIPWDAWYWRYVCRARDARLVEGYADGTFRPEKLIDFAEASKLIVLSHLRTDAPLAVPFQGAQGPWYSPYVDYLAELNAIPLSVRSFDHQVTRGEMAEMIYRLAASVGNLPSQTFESLGGRTEDSLIGGKEWRLYEDAKEKFSLKLPNGWVGFSAYDGSPQVFTTLSDELSFGDSLSRQRIGLEAFYENEVDRSGKTWIEFIQDMRVSPGLFTLTSTQYFPRWIRYEFSAKPGVRKSVALPYVVAIETGTMSVVFEFQRKGTLSEMVLSSFQLLK